MLKVIIKRGDKFNNLTAIKFSHRGKQGEQHWLFRCDCGIEKVICVGNVKREQSKSCGCLLRENASKHKMSKTRIYKSWDAMKQRCLNKNDTGYKDYGKRGIKICLEWIGKNGFINFYKDMGEMPKNKTLDRIDNNGNYCKSNCKWSTRKEQSNNTRFNRFITFNKKTQTIMQWTEELKINYGTLYLRLKRGWSIKRALTFKI